MAAWIKGPPVAEGTIWQRGYYDHVIRGEDELNSTREYIINYPTRWAEDEYHVD